MEDTFYWRAINRALDEELARDDCVLLFGEDVALPGGVFGVTRGLVDRHGGDRVFDTPISESAFVGAAVGAAMAGMRPVAELMFMDFSLVASDQIINHAAKVRFMSQGGFGVPLVIRAQQGVSPASSAQHSQSLEAMFCGVPGLKVVAAATPTDAYGMLKSAIRDDDPVLFLEHRVLYATQGPLAEEEFLEPLDKARIVRKGDDLTLATWLHGVLWAEEVADRLAERDIGVEVIDLRSLQPIDYATLGESIGKTGRAAILHEAIRTGGLGAEIAATLAETQADSLREPLRRFGAAFVPMAVAPTLVPALQPQVDDVVEALSGMVAAKS